MLILYRNVKNARFVLETKTSIESLTNTYSRETLQRLLFTKLLTNLIKRNYLYRGYSHLHIQVIYLAADLRGRQGGQGRTLLKIVTKRWLQTWLHSFHIPSLHEEANVLATNPSLQSRHDVTFVAMRRR